jgi:hypothetical protein
MSAANQEMNERLRVAIRDAAAKGIIIRRIGTLGIGWFVQPLGAEKKTRISSATRLLDFLDKNGVPTKETTNASG